MTLRAGQQRCLGGAGIGQVTSSFLEALGGGGTVMELTTRKEQMMTRQEDSQGADAQLPATT